MTRELHQPCYDLLIYSLSKIVLCSSVKDGQVIYREEVKKIGPLNTLYEIGTHIGLLWYGHNTILRSLFYKLYTNDIRISSWVVIWTTARIFSFRRGVVHGAGHIQWCIVPAPIRCVQQW